MSNIVVRSIFSTTVAERNWKTPVTSTIAHILVIGGAFLITFPVVEDLQSPASEHVTLIAPVLPRVHPLIAPPHITHVAKLVMEKPPEPVKPPPPVVAKITSPPVRPIIHPTVPEKPRIVAEAMPTAPPIPKPVTKSATLDDLRAKAVPVPKQVIVGGFGDPRGAQTSDIPKPQPVLMAKVGSFDSPIGSGQTGGGGHFDSGVKQSAFGSVAVTNNSANGRTSIVRTGNFSDGATGGSGHVSTGSVRSTTFGDTIAAVPPHKDALASVPAFTPVEILFKPRPSYSQEARGMRLEGQVSLEVVFQASGAVKVVRIIKGLGHGLDEAAQQAALQVRFKPATRGGAPVDTNATISITFELT